MKEDLKWTLKFYSLTLIIPIGLTVMNLLFCGILGIESRFGFLMNFKIIWINYYFTGHIGDIVAWKLQLFLLACSFLIVKMAHRD